MVEPAQVMVVTPHPDDAEFGVAGTVARWVRAGRDVVYVVCTNGDKGTSDRNLSPVVLAGIREEEQRAAAKVMGVREVVFLRYPDQGLEDTPEFRRDIVRLIRVYRPETVVTAVPQRDYIWHRDHRITGQTVLDAVFPYARDHLAYPELLAEGLEPHAVREVLLWAADSPNHTLDISDTFDIKMQALGCHKSQVGEEISAAMRERLRQRAEEAARGESFALAEAFYRVEVWW